MKKFVLCMVLLIGTIGAHAQFEKNKWFVNPSVTGLDLSFNRGEKARLGIEVKGGAFLIDNVALILDLGGEYGKGIRNTTKVGVGGRYYFDKSGVFLGLGLNYKHYSGSKWEENYRNDIGLGLEVGYAFFLSKSVTIEPAVYYDQSFISHHDFSKVGLKIGFGFYF